MMCVQSFKVSHRYKRVINRGWGTFRSFIYSFSCSKTLFVNSLRGDSLHVRTLQWGVARRCLYLYLAALSAAPRTIYAQVGVAGCLFVDTASMNRSTF